MKKHHAERDEYRYGYFGTSSFTTAYDVAWAPPISVSMWIVFTTLPTSAPATNVTGTTWTGLASLGGLGISNEALSPVIAVMRNGLSALTTNGFVTLCPMCITP